MIITNSLRPAVVILVPIHKQKTVLAVEEFGTVIQPGKKRKQNDREDSALAGEPTSQSCADRQSVS